MKRVVLPLTSVVVVAVLVALLLPPGSAADKGNGNGKGPEPESKEPTPTIYNPYPAGILPADIDSELMRVEREIQGIEDEALAQAKAFTTAHFYDQPPDNSSQRI